MTGPESRPQVPRTGHEQVDSVLVEVTRGDRVESVHRGHVAVVASDGKLIASVGEPGSISFFRSCAKPFQAVPLVTNGAADGFGLTTEELALACSSHNGTAHHQRVVRSMLRKSGQDDTSLQCGFSPPLDEEEGSKVKLGIEPQSPVQCECSGAHASMVATCHYLGWPIDGYIERHHPLQRETVGVLAEVSGVAADTLEPATDGCSIPTYATSLASIARAYATLADPEEAARDGSPARRDALVRLRGAMAAHPELISGEGEADTLITQHTEGRVIAKLGAGGLLCLAIPGHRLGIAIRETSGAARALGPTAVAVLQQLGVESHEVINALREALIKPVRTFSGDTVGSVRPVITLEGLGLV